MTITRQKRFVPVSDSLLALVSLQVIEITPRRAIARAIIFDAYAVLPDGTQRRIIIAQEDRPDSPIRALEMFSTYQEKHIQKAKRTLESENSRLEQA